MQNQPSPGILFIIDGSKGIHGAIENRLGERVFIQRCQWHKRENIVVYLNDHQQKLFRQKMQEAYQQTTLTNLVSGAIIMVSVGIVLAGGYERHHR